MAEFQEAIRQNAQGSSALPRSGGNSKSLETNSNAPPKSPMCSFPPSRPKRTARPHLPPDDQMAQSCVEPLEKATESSPHADVRSHSSFSPTTMRSSTRRCSAADYRGIRDYHARSRRSPSSPRPSHSVLQDTVGRSTQLGLTTTTATWPTNSVVLPGPRSELEATPATGDMGQHLQGGRNEISHVDGHAGDFTEIEFRRLCSSWPILLDEPRRRPGDPMKKITFNVARHAPPRRELATQGPRLSSPFSMKFITTPETVRCQQLGRTEVPAWSTLLP